MARGNDRHQEKPGLDLVNPIKESELHPEGKRNLSVAVSNRHLGDVGVW